MVRETIIGPMGSEFYRISGLTPDAVLNKVRDMDRKGIGRRIVADAMRGTVIWMSPSSAHEILGDSAAEVIRESCALLGIKSRSMRSTRWKLPGGKSGSGLEADAAFYIGDSARIWHEAACESGQAVDAFEKRTPPDLVVEVEITRFDQDKPRRYRELGVTELWQVSRKDRSRPPAVDIIDLQAENSENVSSEMQRSRLLPGFDRDSLAQALKLAELDRNDDLRQLLGIMLGSASAIPAPTSEHRGRDGGGKSWKRPSPKPHGGDGPFEP